MKKQIYINLPVKNLLQATAFYEGLGFKKNPLFSNEKASCVVWSDEIVVMLLVNEFYKQFILDKEIADAKKVSEVGLCISFESKHAVEKFAQKAKELGGRVYSVPLNQQGEYMYGLSVEDLDGHLWEPLWMDMTKFQEAQKT